MKSLQPLIDLFAGIQRQLARCTRCGTCQAVCPVYAQTGLEPDVARGKIALLEGIPKALIENPRELQRKLERCLLCGSCAANCPGHVEVFEILVQARALLGEYLGLSWSQKLVLRGLLEKPERFDRILDLAAPMQKLILKPASMDQTTSCARFQPPLLKGRHLKTLAPRAFHKDPRFGRHLPGPSGKSVGFFIGCLIDKIYPNIADAAVRSLMHCGLGVDIPAGQGCCGMPALAAGDLKTYASLVEQNLAVFEAAAPDLIVTACATCTMTLKRIWPQMASALPAGLRPQVAALSRKTLDISQVLATQPAQPDRVYDNKPRQVGTKVTYHDPCHLGKSLGVRNEPRQLLGAGGVYELVEMAEADQCCGCGGSFNLAHYEISAAIGRHKRENIENTGCEVLATGCPACMLHIADMLSQARSTIKVRHTVELFAQALGY